MHIFQPIHYCKQKNFQVFSGADVCVSKVMEMSLPDKKEYLENTPNQFVRVVAN